MTKTNATKGNARFAVLARAARGTRAALLAIAATAGPLAAQARVTPASQSNQSLDAYVAKAVRDWNVPGLGIAVVRNDSVLFAKGYGVREIGKPEPADAGTRFAIGSTTKAMTAMALAMLVDEGKLRWDDPVVRHLPWFQVGDPWLTREITVRDLLTHRAGMPGSDLLWGDARWSAAEVTRRIRTLRPVYSLRSGFIYQNVMYAVAGDVVAAVSGMPWEQFVRTRIFQPLGMTNTEATLAALEGKPNVAIPHDEIDGALRVVPNRTVDPVAPAGSVWSSVEDMAKWMRFMLDSARVNGRALLRPATFAELLTPQTIAPPGMYPTTTIVRPQFFTYSLGWFRHDYAGQGVAMHTGSIDGMSAIVGLIPEKRVGVVVLVNRDHAELRHALMYKVFDLYAGTGGAAPRDWSAEFLKLYGGLEQQTAAAERRQVAARVTGTSPSLPLDRYAGTYVDSTYGDVVISVRDGALQLAFGPRRTGRLEHWQYETFRAHFDDARRRTGTVVFQPDGTGGVASLRAFGATFARVASRR